MSIKTKIAAGLLVGAAALTGTAAIGAGEASAKVAPGRYTWVESGIFGTVQRAPATVRGNAVYMRGARMPIASTRAGGVIDYSGARYVLNKRGAGYSGSAYLGPFRTGDVKLLPRR
ncbi:MAG: hypothetical protein QM774_06755 [Gordonia sp. (in: high G+C Gram-positive bacteria)]|uniref:hypothetical protein n=1 Tax=Gordonia sp. (in: high G+C Gram-positive bacteria) TaxID=84139 RepID=UPI0039E418FB